MAKRYICAAVIVAVSVSVLSGCGSLISEDISTAGEPTKQAEEVSTNSSKNIVGEFNYLISRGASSEDAIRFIDKNMSKVSKEDASQIVIKLEALQQKEKIGLEEAYGSSNMAEKFAKEYDIKDGSNKIDSIKDEDLKKLLTETKNSGFKVDTAEGFYFPVIDYSLYQKYSPYVTEDIASYIALMTAESNQAAAKDAALVISWEEVFKRAQNAGSYLNEYSSSSKSEDVKKVYEKYLTFILFGANNTPLFDYDSKVMVPEAQNAYGDFLKSSSTGSLHKTVESFFELVKKNNYKLTDESDRFRKDAVKNE